MEMLWLNHNSVVAVGIISAIHLANSSIRMAIKRSAVPVSSNSNSKSKSTSTNTSSICSSHQFAMPLTPAGLDSAHLQLYAYGWWWLMVGSWKGHRQKAIKIKVIDSIWKCLTHDAGQVDGTGTEAKAEPVKRSQFLGFAASARWRLRGAFQQALVIILSHVWLPLA